MSTKIKCNCIICNKYIGEYFPSQIKKTCGAQCKSILIKLNTKGNKNPNYHKGKIHEKVCKVCGKQIDIRANFCPKHKFAFYKNPFFGKTHTIKTKRLIGKKSKEKFTPDFIERVYHSKHNGLKKTSVNGYTLVKSYDHPMRTKQNDMLEHRLIMEKYLGRYLNKNEIVHHIDFDRTNNNIKNLYLYKTQQEHHIAHTDIYKLIPTLMKNKIIKFKNGKYILI